MYNKSRPLVVLDLDLTLVRVLPKTEDKYDFIVSKDTLYEQKIKKRPYLNQFLASISEIYDIAIWSAGISSYVHNVVNNIFVNLRRPVLIYSREDCIMGLTNSDQHTVLKPLNKIWKKKEDTIGEILSLLMTRRLPLSTTTETLFL